MYKRSSFYRYLNSDNANLKKTSQSSTMKTIFKCTLFITNIFLCEKRLFFSYRENLTITSSTMSFQQRPVYFRLDCVGSRLTDTGSARALLRLLVCSTEEFVLGGA